MAKAVHPALALAREARMTDDPIASAPSAKLFELAADDVKVYKHAMAEAGHIPDPATNEPYKVCPMCGHNFDQPAQAGLF